MITGEPLSRDNALFVGREGVGADKGSAAQTDMSTCLPAAAGPVPEPHGVALGGEWVSWVGVEMGWGESRDGGTGGKPARGCRIYPTDRGSPISAPLLGFLDRPRLCLPGPPSLPTIRAKRAPDHPSPPRGQ